MTRQLASVLSYAAQILIVLAAVGGYVLTMSHHGDTSSYLGAVLPVLGGLGIVARLEARSDKQDASLTQITNQTNGVLDSRIRNGVRDVLAELHLNAGKVDSPDAPAPISPALAPLAPSPFIVPPVTVSEAGQHAASQAAPIATPAPIVPEPLPTGAAPVQTPVPVELGEEVLEALAAIVAKHQGA